MGKRLLAADLDGVNGGTTHPQKREVMINKEPGGAYQAQARSGQCLAQLRLKLDAGPTRPRRLGIETRYGMTILALISVDGRRVGAVRAVRLLRFVTRRRP